MQQQIRSAIQDVLSGLGITDVDFAVEHPADLTHGDYATNIAMVCAKQLGKNPRELAESFVASLEGKIPHVASLTIAGPGFINFHLDRNFFSEQIAEIVDNHEEWGKNNSLKKEEIIFEYTSPNLFKPLHIGNLVGNIIGESISRLFTYGGATVHRVNYPSDIGLTVAKGVYGLIKTKGDPADILAIGEAYKMGNEAYEAGGEAKEEIESMNRHLYQGDNPILNLIRSRGIETSRTHLRTLCEQLGTEFDLEIFESEASEPGLKMVAEHIGDVFEESDGAIVFRGEKYGLHTRVFINSQGLPTYEAKDIGNFVLKHKAFPHWTQYFVVTGGEQREYFKVLIAALREVFISAKDRVIEHIPTGFLTLTTGKMSSRKGNVLTGESLIALVSEEARQKAAETRAKDVDALGEMVAVAAIKYQILRQGIGSDIVFDKERALSFEGDSGPYLQYTYARIQSVLERADNAEVHLSTKKVPETPYALERLIYQFPEIIVKAQNERAPHMVAGFLTVLAGAFNSFYSEEKIADPSDPHAPYKVALAQAVAVTLKNGLWTLGIKAPERM